MSTVNWDDLIGKLINALESSPEPQDQRKADKLDKIWERLVRMDQKLNKYMAEGDLYKANEEVNKMDNQIQKAEDVAGITVEEAEAEAEITMEEAEKIPLEDIGDVVDENVNGERRFSYRKRKKRKSKSQRKRKRKSKSKSQRKRKRKSKRKR